MLVLDLSRNDELDIQTLDMLGELAGELGSRGVELRLAAAHGAVAEMLGRGGLAGQVRIAPSLDDAVRE